MLKKIVKYGNSSALVIDKAILELLNIAEGSVVKVSTNGESLIITPYQKKIVEEVHETFTSHDATLIANIKESFKGVDESVREQKEQEIISLFKKKSLLLEKLAENSSYQADVVLLNKDYKLNDALYYSKLQDLFAKYNPELKQIDEQISNLSLSVADATREEMQDMKDSYFSYFKKLFQTNYQQEIAQVMNSPEFQHRAQLLAEKFDNDKNSKEYQHEYTQLLYEFYPKMKEIHKQVGEIAGQKSKK